MSDKILKGEQEGKLETSESKEPYTEPKLIFVEPKLEKHSDATKVTAQNGGFFGDFSTSSSQTK